MIHRKRIPCRGAVTGLTHIGGVDVAAGQTMTARACTIDLTVINGNHRRPARGTVTGLADIGAVDVTARKTMA
jgi:hypothetical protein